MGGKNELRGRKRSQEGHNDTRMMDGKSPFAFSGFTGTALALPCPVLPSIVRGLRVQGKNESPTHSCTEDLTCPQALTLWDSASQVPGRAKDVPVSDSRTVSASAPRGRQLWGPLRQLRQCKYVLVLLLGFLLEQVSSWHREGLIWGFLLVRNGFSAITDP